MTGTFDLVRSKGDTLAYDPVQARALPYATIEGVIGRAAPAMLVLGQVDGEDLYWFSADRAVLVTRYGRVVKTAGLPRDLTNSRALTPDPLTSAEAPATTRRALDLPQEDIYGLPVYCQWAGGGQESLVIHGLSIDTYRWDEHCEAHGLDWQFTNTFWRDGQGNVWKSLQHYMPETPPLRLAVLKPYGF